QSAVQALEQRAEPRALEGLLVALQDEVWAIRQSAVQALEQRVEPRALEGLLVALQDEVLEVRQSAVQALEQRDEPRVIEALLTALQDKDETVRQSVMQALERFMQGDVPLFSHFEKLGTAGNADLRYALCLALKPLVTMFPERAFRVAQLNLYQDKA